MEEVFTPKLLKRVIASYSNPPMSIGVHELTGQLVNPSLTMEKYQYNSAGFPPPLVEGWL